MKFNRVVGEVREIDSEKMAFKVGVGELEGGLQLITFKTNMLIHTTCANHNIHVFICRLSNLLVL